MLTQQAVNWINRRGLDPELAAKFGLKSCMMPGGGDGIAIPYLVGNQAVNHKYRALAEKQFSQDKGATSCFWNYNALVDLSLQEMPLIITEGEFDALSAIECGFVRAVSVPTGAPSSSIGDNSTTKYSYVEHARAALKEIQIIILAVDGDESGNALLQDLSLRIGKGKCKFVTYPYTDASRTRRMKDLNEVFQKYGAKGVNQVIRDAQWVHVKGVYQMGQLPPIAEPFPYPTGIPSMDDHYKIRMGDITVVTGSPGSGKTTFLNNLLCHTIQKYNWTVAFASFEQTPQTDHRRNLRQWYHGMVPVMQSPDMLAEADKWIDDHFCFIVQDDEVLSDLEWTLEMAATAVTRFNAKVVVIDPWNEIDHNCPRGMDLTEYTGQAIKQFRLLAKRLNVHIILVAHPTKLETNSNGDPVMPGLYNISGSANWYNKPDVGIILHRPKKTVNAVRCYIAKVRQDQVGTEGSVWFSFDKVSRKYYQIADPTDSAEFSTTRKWKGNNHD